MKFLLHIKANRIRDTQIGQKISVRYRLRLSCPSAPLHSRCQGVCKSIGAYALNKVQDHLMEASFLGVRPRLRPLETRVHCADIRLHYDRGSGTGRKLNFGVGSV